MNLLKSFREISAFGTPGLRWKFWLVTCMRLVSTFMDVAALGLIWYTVNSVVNGEFARLEVGQLILFESRPVTETLTFVLGIVAVSFFMLKSAFALLTLRAVRNIAVQFEVSVSSRVLSKALSDTMGGGHSARQALPETQHAISMSRSWVSGSVTSFSTLISDGVLVLSLLTMMIVADARSTVILFFVLGSTAYLLQKFLRKALTDTAEQKRGNQLRWHSDLSGALSSRTQLAVSGLSEEWILGIQKSILRSAMAAAHISLLNSLPRYALELSVLISVSAIIASSFLFGDFANNAAGAALVLAGAFRISSALLPIQAALNSVQVGKVMGKAVRENLSKVGQNATSHDPHLRERIENFAKTNEGKFLIISGPSGVGKTSSVLATLNSKNMFATLKVARIGYGGQDPAVIQGGLDRNIGLRFSDPNFSLEPNQILLSQVLGMEKILERFELKASAADDALILSGGELTRLEILRAHQGNPDLIILDEPTTGLDKSASDNLAIFLNSNAARYVVITHDEFFSSKLAPAEVYEFSSNSRFDQ